MLPIVNRVKTYFKQRRLRKEARQATLIRVTASYESLINEFRLIQEKKSSLTRKERDFVELRIKHLIFKGHIEVNNT